MKMEYKILRDFKKGILLTRQPEIVSDELIITFSDAPDDAVAIFESYATGDSIYRTLQDKTCSVPMGFLKGEISVHVTVMDGKTAAPVFVCEELKAEPVQGSGVLILPNDSNLTKIVAEIQLDMQEIKNELKTVTEKYSELDKKLVKLLEGYDIT